MTEAEIEAKVLQAVQTAANWWGSLNRGLLKFAEGAAAKLSTASCSNRGQLLKFSFTPVLCSEVPQSWLVRGVMRSVLGQISIAFYAACGIKPKRSLP